MLVDTPYPDDRVPPSSEEPVQRWVQLECIHPISIVLLHLISNDIGHLKHSENSEHAATSVCKLRSFNPLIFLNPHWKNIQC